MNIRNLLIASIIIVFIAFGYKWFDGYGLKFGESEKRVEELESQLEKLSQEKANSDAEILVWQNKFDSIQRKEADLKANVETLAKKTLAAESSAAKSKAELIEVRNKTAKVRESIRTIQRTPVNRKGNELIQSLKNKLK
jgi:chromosome segregation ATPase